MVANQEDICHYPSVAVEWVALFFLFGQYSVQTSAKIQAVLTEVFVIFLSISGIPGREYLNLGY
jgi:hypothetical protein